jgi:predicted enzyme related to lactoylglutathione lyase
MGHRVSWFEVTGADGEALRSFYGDLFEWKFQIFPEMSYGTIEAEEGGIAGGVGKAMEGPGRVTFYVDTPDVTASLDKAVSLGGSVLMPETNVMEGTTIGLFADPEGHVVGLLKASE